MLFRYAHTNTHTAQAVKQCEKYKYCKDGNPPSLKLSRIGRLCNQLITAHIQYMLVVKQIPLVVIVIMTRVKEGAKTGRSSLQPLHV